MSDKAKILIIDDEEDICYFSKSILEGTGKFEVIVTTNAKEGIELAKIHKPALILLDIFMPDMDGSQVAECLLGNESTKTIPIVFLTALVKEKDLEQDTGQIGGRYFIPKPVTSKELVAKVETILTEKR